ncbi:MAG TPA: hypothetical protein DCS07_00985 [Bdellovibrionales bacterium]|nr:MAG: hypothetical protein A2Z97_10815 [Bdellovibrionales bacterium GWB1_52_6]OFZ03549.1 MAG: hypothetical protein A2X97_06275 [Bdellovibrionales bacterium GWA1_52_35]OFZ38322.1 MAG: hypothetical protein A2070_14970 [Bdellovibrionales bacterium GWC1_52_8]HAR41202.1 hypothetical protein [Bdellovibrionales bacterium]HCM41136.1 hypothetical protein [Bdellovibrionales bacterium]
MAIIKRKSTDSKIRYQVRVKDSYGQWYPAQTFERHIDAERCERDLMTHKDQGHRALTPEKKDLTLNQYWEFWAKNGRQVHDGWKLGQDQIYRDYIGPFLGEQKLAELRPHKIGSILARARDQGRAPQTVRHIYNLLHKLMGDAVDYFELLDRNPVLKRDRPEVIETERDFLTPAESLRLREKSRSHFLGPAIWLAGLCGLRPSEVQALTWSSVDFANHKIIIKAAYKRKVRRMEAFPKGKRRTRVPVPPVLLEYLTEKHAGQPDSAYVAPGLYGGMLQYEILLKGLKRLCRQAEVKEVSPHKLRHSCSEEWVQAGASKEDVARVLNHSSSRVTERYMHRTDERLTALSQKVGLPFQPVTHLLHMKQKTG